MAVPPPESPRYLLNVTDEEMEEIPYKCVFTGDAGYATTHITYHKNGTYLPTPSCTAYLHFQVFTSPTTTISPEAYLESEECTPEFLSNIPLVMREIDHVEPFIGIIEAMGRSLLRYGEVVKNYPDIPACTTSMFATAQKELWYGHEEIGPQKITETLEPIAPTENSSHKTSAFDGWIWMIPILMIVGCAWYGFSMFEEKKDTKKEDKKDAKTSDTES